MSVSPQEEARVLALVPRGIYVNGEWKDSSDGSLIDVIDPATGKMLVQVANATPKDGMDALAAAHAAQAEWAKTSPRFRAEILRKAFDRVTELADEFAILMSLEMGKPVADRKSVV